MGRFAVVVLSLALATSTAMADTPWADGVTEDQKTRAQVLLEQGNALFLEKKYVEALEAYRQAVAVWDHPAIRFNMVRCEIQLGRNLDAATNLELALRYGEAPFEEGLYSEALGYQKLLSTQIGDVVVQCSQDGVKLLFDGQAIGTCPVTEKRRVLAGSHSLVGTKDGHLPKSVEVVVVGGEGKSIDINLVPVEQGAVIEHRWPTYVPFAVMGGGALLVGTGVMFQLLASDQMDSYDALVAAMCAGNCSPQDLAGIDDMRAGARLKSGIGVSAAITGAAVILTGGVMLYLNRGRTVYPEIAPVATGSGAVLSLGGSW